MQRRALITTLVLTLPLALYGIPYAYAVSTSPSTYVVVQSVTVPPGSISAPSVASATVPCNSGDYATGGGWILGNSPPGEPINAPTKSGTPVSTTGTRPDGWQVTFENPNGISYAGRAYVVCQANFTIAGVGVPEFGSLYLAIALGALVYFMLSRRSVRRPMLPAQVQA